MEDKNMPIEDTEKVVMDKDVIAQLHQRIEEQEKTIRNKVDELNSARREKSEAETDKERAINEAIGCLHAVKAMLTNSCNCGATHRQRDFFGEAIVKYIDQSINNLDFDKDPNPF